MVRYRCIGYGITDNNGIATLDHDLEGHSIGGYTGHGVGEINIVASAENPSEIHSSNDISSPVEIMDYILMDYTPLGKNGNFEITNITTWNSGGVTEISTPLADERYLNGSYINRQVIIGDFELIIECRNVNGGGARVGCFNKTSTNYTKGIIVSVTETDYILVKFKREDEVWTVQRSDNNGETWTNYINFPRNDLGTEDCYFGIYLPMPEGATEKRMRYKNLKAYYI